MPQLIEGSALHGESVAKINPVLIAGKDSDNKIKAFQVDNSGSTYVTSKATQSSATITRPNNTDAYTAGDVVGESPAANLTFANVSALAGSDFIIMGATLEIDVASIPSGMSSFRLHLYDSAPTAIADNAAYNLPSDDRSKYLGYIEFITINDLGDTLWAQESGVNMKRKLVSTALYGILQSIGAYTPSAQAVKKVTLHIVGV